MSLAADTSVVVPALLVAHPEHDRCRSVLAGTTRAIAHVTLEAYSVLTRLPHPYRVEPQLAARALASALPGSTVALGAEDQASAPARLAAAGLSGGSVYDALIALTAAKDHLALLTRDARAARTYRSLGVAFELMV